MSGEAYTIHAALVRGVEAVSVSVEVNLAHGIPGIQIIGMPATSVLEARTRVRCALKASGFSLPRMQITVNLAPADIKKTGTLFDLPIAVGILAATGQIPTTGLEKMLFMGELGLDGEVCHGRGSVAYLLLAKRSHLGVCGAVDWAEAAALNCEAIPMSHLSELRRGIAGLSEQVERPETALSSARAVSALDFGDVIDQELPKRALVIAAAGNHSILMVGPPGTGKSMLAQRLPTILPPLSEDERIEAALIRSVAGLDTSQVIRGVRPFASPHHTVSMAGLVGGGRPVMPGQISLAHNGVLFLDELPEFPGSVLQSLRQPIEEGEVRITRVDGAYTFPSRFQLVGAANPCPCGHLGETDVECTCSPAAVEHYQAKVGGPVMDRIDMRIDVVRPHPSRVIRGHLGLTSDDMAAQVTQARDFASWRETQSQDSAEAGVVGGLSFSGEAADALDRFARAFRLGGRGVARVARVARTIADLAQAPHVLADHVAEASLFRSRESLGGEGL